MQVDLIDLFGKAASELGRVWSSEIDGETKMMKMGVGCCVCVSSTCVEYGTGT